MKLIGKGFLNLVDHVFWHLRFSSVKQAHAVREKANPPVSEKDWAARFEAMSTRRKEHGSSWQLDGKRGWLLGTLRRRRRRRHLLEEPPRPSLHRPGGLTSWRIRFSYES